ncbi:MAG: hypothetical protein AB1644_09505 [Candidatus Zixiibacteriota bacterium]
MSARRTFFRTLSALVVSVLFITPTVSSAEDSRDLLNHRVRVTAPAFSSQRIDGLVASFNDNTLRLEDCRPNLDLQLVPTASITKIERFEGRHGNTLKGALIGGGIGLATFGILVVTDTDNDPNGWEEFEDAMTVAFGVMFVGGGTLTGGLIGTFIRNDRWREVPLDQYKFNLYPANRHGVGLTLSMRF